MMSVTTVLTSLRDFSIVILCAKMVIPEEKRFRVIILKRRGLAWNHIGRAPTRPTDY
jgi:hypothetical protein